jgi:hypothetical protein
MARRGNRAIAEAVDIFEREVRTIEQAGNMPTARRTEVDSNKNFFGHAQNPARLGGMNC